MERPSLRQPAPVMYAIPTGALMDIPTGEYLAGTHDQQVLLAGLSFITGIVGPGNSFKTTIMRYMILSALARTYKTVTGLYYSSYDTEINTHENRNRNLSWSFDVFKGKDIQDEGVWQLTNKAVYQGNEYWMEVKKYLKDKATEKKPKLYETAFLDRDHVSPMKVLTPTFNDIDSLSQFITADVEKTMETTELSDSAGNTIFMRQGLAKSKMLLEMPQVAAQGFNFFSFTAHTGDKINIPSGPGAPPPRKQLQYMPGDTVIKGVSNNFFYLLHNCWLVTGARPFLNKDTKAPEYPIDSSDQVAGDLDLNIVTLKQLRGKNGGSGFSIELIVSQKEGVQASLSEFHYLRRIGQYGMVGNSTNYTMALYPDVSLSRTKVRSKISQDPKLRRALEITSQLAQLEEFHRHMKPELISPEELHKALIEKGYDWDWLLTHTRSWHTLDDEKHPGYPLSTYDFCRVAKGQYHPYWLEADCKTVKPHYQKLKEQVHVG